MSAQIRARWRLHLRTWHTMGSVAREVNPIVRAGCSTTGRSALRRVNTNLMRWLRKKNERLASKKKSRACWERVTAQYPRQFAHWARICGGLGAEMPRLPELRVRAQCTEEEP